MNKFYYCLLLISFSFLQMNISELPVRNNFDYQFNRGDFSKIKTYRNEEELIQFIENTINVNLIPGLSVSVSKNGNLVWEKYFGYANLEDGIFVDENTMFILSSISKTITATALMHLFENSSFSLDDDIDDYLPFNVNHPDYPFIPISFRMLLAHTSGINDNWYVMPYYEGDSPFDLQDYLTQYFTPGSELYYSNANFTNSMPGENFNYSNIGAALIGLLVEEISNISFNQYCINHIFEPLQMNNSFWFLSEIEDTRQVAVPYQQSGGTGNSCYDIGCGYYNEESCYCDDLCSYYEDCCNDYEFVCGDNGTGSNPDNLTTFENYGYSDYPAGQLRASSNNLGKFMQMYLNDGIFNGTRILEPETISLIKNIQFPAINSQQALIWYYKNSDERYLFGHNGGDIGSLTEMFISFENDIGVVLLSNSNNYNGLIEIEKALFNFADENNFTILGDLNSDSNINIQDIIIIVNLILIGSYVNTADLNYDDTIDILDVIQILNIIIN